MFVAAKVMYNPQHYIVMNHIFFQWFYHTTKHNVHKKCKKLAYYNFDFPKDDIWLWVYFAIFISKYFYKT